MTAYFFLLGAILFEVTGTMMLPLSKNFTKPLPSIALTISYIVSFYLLTYAIKDIPIAIAYASWGGLGIFLITLLGYIFYGQMLQWESVLGLAFIALGVAIVNIYKT